MRIQIFLLFFMVMCALSRFVWINLTVLLPSRRSNSKIVLVVHWVLYAVLAIFLGLAFFSFLIGRFFVGFEPYFISRVAFTCLGLFLLVFFNLCVLSVVFAVMRVCSFSLPNADKLKAIMAITVSLLLCIQGLTAASRGPTIVGVTVPLARLPRSLDGTRIVQLSDIHLGPMIGQAALDRVVNMVSVIKPDIIVITGDLVDSTVANLKQAILPLKNLKSKYGSFFVTGNHEYLTGDADAWLQELKQLGIEPLHNSHVLISSKDSPEDKIYLAGVDDIQADSVNYENHGMKLPQALSGRHDKFPTILLAHQPWAARQALKEYQDIDLILSGHTHGGQFFPMHIPIYFYNPFFSGLYKEKETFVYVSSGTYFYSVPLRIGSTPEITVVTLTRVKQ